MSDFRFNFEIEEDESGQEIIKSKPSSSFTEDEAALTSVDDQSVVNELECCEIMVMLSSRSVSFDQIKISPHITLWKSQWTKSYVDADPEQRPSSEIEKVACSRDLLSGVYEGGFKLWEGSVDLCRMLCPASRDYNSSPGIRIDPASGDLILTVEKAEKGLLVFPIKSVFEIGCGHGLPTVLILRQWLQSSLAPGIMPQFVFQDYVGTFPTPPPLPFL